MQICWIVLPNYGIFYKFEWFGILISVPGFRWRSWLFAASPHRWTRTAGTAQSAHSHKTHTVQEEVSAHIRLQTTTAASVVRVFTFPLLLCVLGVGEDGWVQPEPGRLRLTMDHKAYEAPLAHMVNRPIVHSDSTENNFWVCTEQIHERKWRMNKISLSLSFFQSNTFLKVLQISGF